MCLRRLRVKQLPYRDPLLLEESPKLVLDAALLIGQNLVYDFFPLVIGARQKSL